MEMILKDMLKLVTPPVFIHLAKWLCGNGLMRKPILEYAPMGWQTPLTNPSHTGWNTDNVVTSEQEKWDAFVRNCQGSGPLGFSHESSDLNVICNVSFHNIHLTYAYVLALAAQQKSAVSVLDWGGGLGHYYLLGKAVLPDVELDFHCKEVPVMAEAGKRINPDVHWYADESCLERTYDLVMINGSLQYIMDWADTLQRIIPAVSGYLFLTRLPVVDDRPGFVAIQRAYGTEMLHQQLNQTAVLQTIDGMGFRLIREFVVGDRPYIISAPEQCELRGWLFKRI
jgi:putative methyltransferase (TIGR04325 family)